MNQEEEGNWIEYYCKKCGALLVKINPKESYIIAGSASAECQSCGTLNKLY